MHMGISKNKITSAGDNDPGATGIIPDSTGGTNPSSGLDGHSGSASDRDPQEPVTSRTPDYSSSDTENNRQKDLTKETVPYTSEDNTEIQPGTSPCNSEDDKEGSPREQAEIPTTAQSPSSPAESASSERLANGHETPEQHDGDLSGPMDQTNREVPGTEQLLEDKDKDPLVKDPEGQRNDDVGESESASEKNMSESEKGNPGELRPEDPKKEEFIPEDIDDNSEARLEWIRQKREEGAKNTHIDELMCQVGLEDVKSMFLSMKATVEAVERRGGKIDLDLSIRGSEGIGVSIDELFSKFKHNLNIGDAPLKFSRSIEIHDYSDDELYGILKKMIENNSIEVEGGLNGPYIHILVQRIGRGRGSKSFQNMTSMNNAFAEACIRQANRLQEERIQWVNNGKSASNEPNDYFFTKEDILGHPPPDIRHKSAAYKELHGMVGLGNVKEAVEELMDLARTNYFLELHGKQLIQPKLNRVFLGPSGSGKTTVSRLFGQIIVDMGLVSQAEVVVKDASDFISQWVGGETQVTKEILKKTEGKVLIIDNAHGLCPTSELQRSEDKTDAMYRSILNVLVANTSSNPGEDRSIIMVGYPEKMHDLFHKCNPGLRSRFPLEEEIELQDYELPELTEILVLKLTRDGIGATEQAKEVASRILARARHRPSFGNARDVHSLVDRARTSQKRRAPNRHKRFDLSESTSLSGVALLAEGDEFDEQVILTPEDFDPNWDRLSHAELNLKEQFKDYVGFENIIGKFQELQEIVAGMRLHTKDPRPHIPFTFVFKGPPGTGKTSTARKLGSLFYEMGFLAKDDVVECSASDLIGHYVGHTGPLVQSMLEQALGKVLFIDEAYRLGSKSRGISGSSFAEEAVGELVDSLTKPRYMQKIVIILAGYSEDMDDLMKSNRGLRGRFATEIIFPQLTPDQCIQFLGRLVGQMGITIRDRTVPTAEKKSKVNRLFEKLSATRDWANGRDIETLAKIVVGEVFREEGRKGKKSSRLQISTDQLIAFLQSMLRGRLAGQLQDHE